MNKTVLIVSASPRKNGNSDILCDEFMKGARSAGHTVQKLFLKDHTVRYCTGCGLCENNRGTCSQKDDMSAIRQKMINADVIVFATPVYFYSMCGQLKTFIDRNCFFYTELKNKELYFIMTAAQNTPSAMDKTMGEFTGYMDCLPDAVLKGVLSATGVRNKGDVETGSFKQKAFAMGTAV